MAIPTAAPRGRPSLHPPVTKICYSSQKARTLGPVVGTQDRCTPAHTGHKTPPSHAHPERTAASPHSGRSQHDASQVPHACGTEGRSTQDPGPPRDVSAREAASLNFRFQVPAPWTSPGKCRCGWIAGRTDGGMNGGMNGRRHERKQRRMDSRRTDGWERGQTDERTDGQMGGGWMYERWMGGG